MKTSILILAERVAEKIHPVTFELIGKARELAGDTGEVHSLLLGDLDTDGEKELFACGCDKVYQMDDPCFRQPLEELFAGNIVSFIKEKKPEIILIGATNFGRSLAPRISAALKAGLTADCTKLVLEENGDLVQIRPAFSGNILAHIISDRKPQMATIRYQEFPQPERIWERQGILEKIPPYMTGYEKNEIIEILEKDGVDITEAEVIVAAGRGIKRKEDLEMIRTLAKLLGGELAVTRTLVDAGMADTSIQVGYSGHRVKPRVYIACGISGAPQHVAGMEEAEYIFAINSDPSAPIFSHSTYGIVGDLYEVVPGMIRDLEKTKEENPS